jgi:hypothetical protein
MTPSVVGDVRIPQQRTFTEATGTSALCHEQTSVRKNLGGFGNLPPSQLRWFQCQYVVAPAFGTGRADAGRVYWA